MKKIKIAFIISNLGQGGAESQFIKLITNLDKSKYDISLLLYATQTKPFFEAELVKYNITTTIIKLTHRFVPIKIAEAIYKINRFLTTDNFDVVVTSLFMNNLFVRIAAPYNYKNKIITNIRTSYKNYSAFYRFFERILISKSFIVFNSKKALYSFKNIFHQKYYNRLHCIYNGYEIPQKHIEGPSTLVFGSLGRLNIEKNILQAVRVFQEFEKDNPEAHYIIQGHFGNQYKTIKQEITSTNIEIRDKTPEIEKFYNSINVLILPSIFEGCPNVLFEALLRKKICIVSKGANSDCFIQNGVNGFVYDGTDNGLFQALQTVQRLFYTHKANEIINNAYHYAVNNFSISTMIAEYENLFLKIYEENKSSN